MYASQLSQLVPLHYRHGFHSRLADLNRILRYILGGERPTQTARQILSLAVFAVEVRKHKLEEWYFTDDSILPESRTSKSPIYATHLIRILNTKLQ
jgi:hypothetical protein